MQVQVEQLINRMLQRGQAGCKLRRAFRVGNLGGHWLVQESHFCAVMGQKPFAID